VVYVGDQVAELLKLSHLFLHFLFNSIHEVLGVKVHAILDVLQSVNASGQVLGHVSVIHAVHASGLQSHTELLQVRIIIQLGPVLEAARPSEDTGDRVGGSLLALLMLTVVASYSTYWKESARKCQCKKCRGCAFSAHLAFILSIPA
jgi:hypothetical protein